MNPHNLINYYLFKIFTKYKNVKFYYLELKSNFLKLNYQKFKNNIKFFNKEL